MLSGGTRRSGFSTPDRGAVVDRSVQINYITCLSHGKETLSVHEFRELHAWLDGAIPHRITLVNSLPEPTFDCGGRQLVSFSTNN